MAGTLWVHDTIDTGRAGLAGLASATGYTPVALPPPNDAGPWAVVLDAAPAPSGAILTIRQEADAELLVKLRAALPGLPIFALLVGAEDDGCEDLVDLGATGALPWESTEALLTAALPAVLAGCKVLPAAEQPKSGPGPRFTDREIGWLRQLERHCRVDDLAAESCVARRTMHRHLKDLYAKLGTSDRESALAAAHRRRLI